MNKLKSIAQDRLQIIKWLPKYSKLDVISDMVAGLSVGLTMIPQSIAYAGLAGLPAQYGLYTAFIGSFTYIFLGTVKQVSIGPTSLMSILTFSYVEGMPLESVFILTFLAGIVELGMGIFKLGFLVDFISPCVTSGFTTSTSVIIIVAQLKNFLGLNQIKSHSFFSLCYKIGKNIGKISLPDTLLGLSCILFLFCFSKLTSIPVRNKIIKKVLWFLSISKNAIVVLLSACVGYYFLEIQGNSPFALSGNVPSGMPAFKFPRFSAMIGDQYVGFWKIVSDLGSGIIVVPVCAILANVAIAKSFTSGIIVDASQEMITLGICNIFGSCVQAMPSCGAFSRSAVANSSGVRTPLQGLYSGSVIILALSFLTPYFYYIPKSTLAAVLMFAVTSLIDFKLPVVLWKTNQYDFWMNFITCWVGVIFGADIGIILGAVLNLLPLLKIWTRPKIIKEIRTCHKGKEFVYIKPELGICYPSVDFLNEEILKFHNENTGLPIAVDCINVLKLDYSGAQALYTLVENYNKGSKKLVLLNVSSENKEHLKHFIKPDKLSLCQSNESLDEDLFATNLESSPLLHENEDAPLKKIIVETNLINRKKSLYDNVM